MNGVKVRRKKERKFSVITHALTFSRKQHSIISRRCFAITHENVPHCKTHVQSGCFCFCGVLFAVLTKAPEIWLITTCSKEAWDPSEFKYCINRCEAQESTCKQVNIIGFGLASYSDVSCLQTLTSNFF